MPQKQKIAVEEKAKIVREYLGKLINVGQVGIQPSKQEKT